MSKLLICSKTEELVIRNDNIIRNINNKYKSIKNIIMRDSYNLLELVNYTNILEVNKRLNSQRKLLVKIKMLDFYFHNLFVLREISDSTYKSISKDLTTITKLVYGWIKSDSKTK